MFTLPRLFCSAFKPLIMRRRVQAVALVIGLTSLLDAAAFAAELPQAPEWGVTTLDGRKFDQTSLLGKVVLIHFWASWCEPCRKEMPVLQAFYENHEKDGFEVVAISMDDDSDLAKVRSFVRSFTFPVAMNGRARMDGFGRIRVLPLSFLINREGKVSKSNWTGEEKITVNSLNDHVLPLLASSGRLKE